MLNSQYSNPERERAVLGFLSLISDFGNSSERFFDRLYRGLRRKQTATDAQPPEEPDQLNALKQANRELQAQVREARNMSARLRGVFSTISEGVIVQDQDGRIVLINDSAYKLLGSIKAFWESELGRMFERVRNDTPAARPVSEVEPYGDPVRVQLNNRVVGAQLAIVYLGDGSPLGSLIVLRDVTREALADRLRDEFVTQITHELRTPLTSIKGLSDVLISQPADRPINRKFLETIGRNAAVLDRMIIELLDISEISVGSFEVRGQELYLDELVLDVIKGQDPRIKKADLNVSMMAINKNRLKIIGDDRRLRWAIGHLLDNAINYTLPGGTITLRVGQIKNERVLLDVIDNGTGISDRDLPHIFERFYRGEALNPQGKKIDPRGLGQGLFIARAVAEAHQGYLVVSSNVGQGSKFTLGLPVAK